MAGQNEPGNERFVKDGHFHVSVAEVRRERIIDIQTVILLLTSIR